MKLSLSQLLYPIALVLSLLSCLLYADVHHPQVFLNEVEGRADEGTQIVQHYCASCHADKPLIPIGAPRPHNKADWGPRLKQGLDALFRHADEGINAMPPRGGAEMHR